MKFLNLRLSPIMKITQVKRELKTQDKKNSAKVKNIRIE